VERRRAVRVAVLIALCAATAVPCSFDETPAFSFRIRPDDPIEDYVNGRIGIIGREYARSHLVVVLSLAQRQSSVGGRPRRLPRSSPMAPQGNTGGG
jgi:hypothetical protein